MLKVANTGRMGCPAVTIDPVDPDIVRGGARTGSSSISASVNVDDNSVALGVSKDGGKTWTMRVLHGGRGGTCPDLVAPAKNAIVVESPRQQNCDGNPDLDIGTVNLDGNPHPPVQLNTYLQCSDDAGKTFSAPLFADPASVPENDHSSAIGVFGPNGTVAVS